jgi:hypothetical protein
VRSSGTIFAAVIFLAGFLQGPFDHIHPDEYLEHEVTSAPVHFHFAERVSNDGPLIALLSADDDEVDVLWSAARTPSVEIPFHAVMETWICPPEPATNQTFALLPQPRGHDPPPFRPLIPRAPPA